MWEFYLAGSETAFRYQGLVVFQLQLAKRIDAVPTVRDYILLDAHKLAEHEAIEARPRMAGE
jgi:cyclopropane-fatty-acyl-phospholipid synthase